MNTTETEQPSEPYDSRPDTREHITKVRHYLDQCVALLCARADDHDQSKLIDPEKSAFDHLTPKLRDMAYGSEEYRACLREMKPALQHHYEANRHHPEHFPNGVNDMNLFDILEMLMDWKAATERMSSGGDIHKSIAYNMGRFKIDRQLGCILFNTARAMDWPVKEPVSEPSPVTTPPPSGTPT